MAHILFKVAGTLSVGAGTTLMLVAAAARAGAFAAAHITPAMSFGGLVIGLLAFACGVNFLEKK